MDQIFIQLRRLCIEMANEQDRIKRLNTYLKIEKLLSEIESNKT